MISHEQSYQYFFTGKGGVGKSTSAALRAVFLSEKEYRVALVSLDPAHNQCDIFEMPFSDKARKVGSNLFVIEVDQERWIKKEYERDKLLNKINAQKRD